MVSLPVFLRSVWKISFLNRSKPWIAALTLGLLFAASPVFAGGGGLSAAFPLSDALTGDLDGNGLVNAGDLVTYTTQIDNTAGLQDLVAVIFHTGVDPNSTLIVGSVTTTAGTVTIGNNPGDTTVEVDLDSVLQGETQTITFVVRVNTPIPAGVTQLSVQGTYQVQLFPDQPTDDPDTIAINDPTITPLDLTAPRLTAQKTSALVIDPNGNGLLEPGETLEYTIVLTNNGDGDAASIVFTDTPGLHTSLVTGSVSTSQGTITNGNQTGDTLVGVTLGTIAKNGGNATVRFRITVENPLPSDVQQVQNQGVATGANIANRLTDDPNTPVPDDPTVDPVVVLGGPVQAIPALDPTGAALLALALTGLAVGRLRRRGR